MSASTISRRCRSRASHGMESEACRRDNCCASRLSVDPLWVLAVVFIVLGLFVGFLAGLLGVGGGMTIVPLLIFVFTRERFPVEHVVHMAIATSTASIVFTSLSSVRV